MLFHQIHGAVCVLRSRGVYKQCDVFTYGERIFAKWGGGFIGLKKYDNGTTIPNVSWEHVEGVDFAFASAPSGNMIKATAMRKAA